MDTEVHYLKTDRKNALDIVITVKETNEDNKHWLQIVLASNYMVLLWNRTDRLEVTYEHSSNQTKHGPVSWDCRIHVLLLCWRVRSLPTSGPVGCGCRIHLLLLYSMNVLSDPKQSGGEAPVMLKLWEMRGTPSLPSLPDPLWPGVATPNRVLSMGQIELFNN